jgi:hypothetical protein
MGKKMGFVVLGLSLLAAGSADAEIIKGVMAVKGAEMS